MCNVEEPGGPAGHRICHLVPNVKEYIRICYMVLNVNGLKIQISAGLGAPQGRKSRSDLDQPNIPVWRRGWGGSLKVPNVKSDTVAVPNVKHPLW